MIPLASPAATSAPSVNSEVVVLYGATGYTGRLVLAQARSIGLKMTLAGRNPREIPALAASEQLPHAIASLDDPSALAASLRGTRVLLNAAGPFSRTAAPLMAAALRAGVHYLDVTGEIDVFLHAAELDQVAREADVMLMPGVGFDVVPSDCLASHVAKKLPLAAHLRLGISGLRYISRGSARTLVQQLARPIRARRNGQLVPLSRAASEHCFDFGSGPRSSRAVDWGDLVTAYYSTGIRDVTTYFEATPALRAALVTRDESARVLRLPAIQAWLEMASGWLPEGPTVEQRSRVRAVLVAEAEGPHGQKVAARLETPEVYGFTASCAVQIALQVALGNWEPGFQTPSRVFGSEFVLQLPGVVRHDLPDFEGMD